MMRWLKANSAALQALGAVLTALIALAALVGVKLQVDAGERQSRVQSARDIYREFLNLSIARPELADPDHCAIPGSSLEAPYENYLEYALYTAEQLRTVSPEWDATMLDHLAPHRAAICEQADWTDDTPGVQALVAQFKARECQTPVEPCAE
jgi:hypothetical protein